MKKGLKGISIFLFSVLVGNYGTLSAMDGNISNIQDSTRALLNKGAPNIDRNDYHLSLCALIGDFDNGNQVESWINKYFPKDYFKAFVNMFRNTLLGTRVKVSQKLKYFDTLPNVLDLMICSLHSNEITNFLRDQNRNDGADYNEIKVSKIFVPFYEYYTMSNRVLLKLNYCGIEIIAEPVQDINFERPPLIYVRYENVCFSNLVRSNDVVYEGVNRRTFRLQSRDHYIFGRKDPLAMENVVIKYSC